MFDTPRSEIRFAPTLNDVFAAKRLAGRSAPWRYGFGGAACGLSAAAVTLASGAFPLAANVLIGLAVGFAYAALLAVVWRVWFPRRIARLYRQQSSLRHLHVVG